MNQDDQRDDLWELLGKARSPRVSPFFARNILRAIHESQEARPSLFAFLLRRWRMAAVIAVLVGSVGISVWHSETPKASSAAQQIAASPDYEDLKQEFGEGIETKATPAPASSPTSIPAESSGTVRFARLGHVGAFGLPLPGDRGVLRRDANRSQGADCR